MSVEVRTDADIGRENVIHNSSDQPNSTGTNSNILSEVLSNGTENVPNIPSTDVPTLSATTVNQFAFLNIQGLCPQTCPSKVPFIKSNICNENLLFVGLSETWLKSHKEAELTIEGYTLFRCDTSRKKRSRGRLT